nr:hypothetical protein [Halomicroarcula sp. XH51]
MSGQLDNRASEDKQRHQAEHRRQPRGETGLALAVPFGYVPIWLAVLAGDAGMTLGVTGNAMRLPWVVPDAVDGEAASPE